MALRQGSLEDLGVSFDFWKGCRVLVTGHTGFKGAWLSLWLEKLGAELVGLALETDSTAAYAGLQPSIESHLVDLRDADRVSSLVQRTDPHVIFHLAAQSLVRESYRDPRSTYEVNVIGTLNLLRTVSPESSVKAVIVTTTDKVYRNLEAGRPFVEDDPLGGFDPYSSSKACVEILVESWRKSFLRDRSVALHTARSGNVIGGGDGAADRLIPDAFRALRSGEPLVLRYPEAVRPWQFVLEPLSGYLALAEAAIREPASLPSSFNFGPPSDSWVPVAAVIDRLFALWGWGAWQPSQETNPAESSILKLDSARAETVLGWRNRLDLDTALSWTVEWQRAYADGKDVRELSLDQIDRYERTVSGAG